MSYCTKCGQENSEESKFCDNCGAPLKKSTSQTKEVVVKTSRTIEMVLGILGGVFGLIGAIIAFFIGSLGSAFAVTGSSDVTVLGASAFLASIVGIVGAVYVTKDPKIGGIILIISAIWLLISISLFGLLGAVLLGIAGVIALIRN
jgi:hypothetical protein